jgi:hypothetical protein
MRKHRDFLPHFAKKCLMQLIMALDEGQLNTKGSWSIILPTALGEVNVYLALKRLQFRVIETQHSSA